MSRLPVKMASTGKKPAMQLALVQMADELVDVSDVTAQITPGKPPLAVVVVLHAKVQCFVE